MLLRIRYACSWKGVGVPEVVTPSLLICAQLTDGRLPSKRTPDAIRVALLMKGTSPITQPLSIRLNVTAMTSGSLLCKAYWARVRALAEIDMGEGSYED